MNFNNWTATVVITTKNRKDDLRNAVRSAVEQSVRPEVIMIDDGSTDGTSEMIRKEFPDVRLERNETSTGYIAARNRGAQLATGDVIFSIDDDAVFSTPDVVAQTLGEFDDPRVGAVAIPFINVRQDCVVHQKAPDALNLHVCAHFIGTAHAIRKDLFASLGGYRTALIHQGEEGDLCLRMLDSGYVVRSGTAAPIHHFESPRRDHRRMAFYGRRNDILFAWFNIPMPAFPFHLFGTTLMGLRFVWKRRRDCSVSAGLKGIAAGYRDIFKYRGKRDPVRKKTYFLYRHVKRRDAVSLSSIQPALSKISEI